MARTVDTAVLNLPDQVAGKPPIELTQKALAEWRDALPLANLQESTRAIFRLLRETNRLRLNEKQRVLLLEQLHPLVDSISLSISNLTKRHASPLPEKVIRLVRVNEGLLAEAALGYKSLLAANIAKRSMFLHRERQLCESLQGALHYLGRIVLEAYDTYVPFPEGIWGEIHAIYRLASELRITHLKSEEFSDGGRISIADDYKRLLLFALATPYQLERSAIGRLFGQLGRWSSAMRLLDDGSRDDKLQIVVRIEDDRPPCFQVMENAAGSAQASHRTLRVDTSGLLAILDRELERVQDGSAGKEKPLLSPEVVVALREGWSGPTTRGELRYKGAMTVRVAIGLNAVYYYLRRRRPAVVPDASGSEPSDEGQELELSLDGDPAEYGSTITEAQRDSIAELLMPQETAASWTEMRARGAPEIYPCTTIDFSSSGCQLTYNGGKAPNFNVGDILCLGFEESGDNGWKIGVIRWLRQSGDQEISLGVRILASAGRAVTAGVCSESGYIGDQNGCLLLADENGTTLVTPRMPYARGKLVRYDDSGEQQYIRLGANLENSSRFARFRFHPLTEDEMAPIRAERDRPVAEAPLPSRLGESSVEELLEDRTAWDDMPKDW